MKIAIISAWDAGYEVLAKATVPNREAYCSRHGYEFVGINNHEGTRTPQWSRLDVARQIMGLYDAVFIMDIDAVITNQDIKLEDLLTHDFIATADINGFNCGMILLRTSDWSKDFMERYWQTGERYLHHVNPEQTCLAHMLVCEPKDRWDVKPQRYMNSFPYGEYPELKFPEGTWEPGDFILHVPALSLEVRLELLARALGTTVEPSQSVS